MLITLQEYADNHKISYSSLRNAMCKGKWKADIKIKNRWYVEDNKPWYTSNRQRLNKEIDGKAASYSRVYNIWRCMKQRCNNPKNSAYYRYGGRGITVCEEWNNNSKVFIEWALSHGYADNLELDRIDNNKGYFPDNCQWITKTENSRKSVKPYTHPYSRIKGIKKYYEWEKKELNYDWEKAGMFQHLYPWERK